MDWVRCYACIEPFSHTFVAKHLPQVATARLYPDNQSLSSGWLGQTYVRRQSWIAQNDAYSVRSDQMQTFYGGNAEDSHCCRQ